VSVPRLALALALSTACGCYAHVPLPPAPPAAAPLAERVSYYNQFRPRATSGMAQVTFGTFGGYSAMQTSVDHVVLANGTVVSDPEDLLQMVGPDAPLAGSVRRATSAQTVASGVTWGGVAASVAGTILMLTSIGSASYDGLGTPFWAGFGVALAGSIATGVGRWGLGPSASAAREAVYVGLDGAIRAHMSLCGPADAVHDCNAAPPVAAPPPPPPGAPSQGSPWAAPPPLPPPPVATGVSIHAR
jgi:hypothetical protein